LQYEDVFDYFFNTLKMIGPHEPLTAKFDPHNRQPVVNSLFDPCSKAACLILWLFSIEPPFYKFINVSVIGFDEQVLETLGPIARALYCMVGVTET